MHSALYTGWLSHRRHAPREHSFRYPLFMAWLDLGELDQVFAGHWLWSCTRPAPARFDRRDHLGDPEMPLDESVRSLVEQRTGHRPLGPVRLLTHLRYFGYGFNPVSFYYCFSADDSRVEAVVAEVNNMPWRERHCYVIPNEGTAGPVQGTSAKAMHVSPFHPMELQYRWAFSEPGRRLGVRMELFPLQAAPASPVFDATLSLKRQEITGARLAATLLRFPFMTARVVAAIHWQALLLWLKRVPVHDHPRRRRPASPPLSQPRKTP